MRERFFALAIGTAALVGGGLAVNHGLNQDSVQKKFDARQGQAEQEERREAERAEDVARQQEKEAAVQQARDEERKVPVVYEVEAGDSPGSIARKSTYDDEDMVNEVIDSIMNQEAYQTDGILHPKEHVVLSVPESLLDEDPHTDGIQYDRNSPQLPDHDNTDTLAIVPGTQPASEMAQRESDLPYSHGS